jgi:hypothetical protein
LFVDRSLFDPPLGPLAAGLTKLRPPSWPLPASTPVFVLDSTSGRTAVAKSERAAQFASLATVVDERAASIRDVDVKVDVKVDVDV